MSTWQSSKDFNLGNSGKSRGISQNHFSFGFWSLFLDYLFMIIEQIITQYVFEGIWVWQNRCFDPHTRTTIIIYTNMYIINITNLSPQIELKMRRTFKIIALNKSKLTSLIKSTLQLWLKTSWCLNVTKWWVVIVY